MLFASFGNYTAKDINYHVRPFTFFNKLDEKSTTQQEGSIFTEMMSASMKMAQSKSDSINKG